MKVWVNGSARAYDDEAPPCLADVVAGLSAAPRGIAVAVNADVVPRGAWPSTRLGDGDRVEVLTAVQGG